jgi:hypothetical protein
MGFTPTEADDRFEQLVADVVSSVGRGGGR